MLQFFLVLCCFFRCICLLYTRCRYQDDTLDKQVLLLLEEKYARRKLVTDYVFCTYRGFNVKPDFIERDKN